VIKSAKFKVFPQNKYFSFFTFFSDCFNRRDVVGEEDRRDVVGEEGRVVDDHDVQKLRPDLDDVDEAVVVGEADVDKDDVRKEDDVE